LRVIEGVQVRAPGDAEALDADADPGEVHKEEHLAHAAMLDLTHELTDAGIVIAELHDAGRGRLDAHLILDARDGDIIVFAEAAVFVHADSRNDEERKTLG